MDYTFQEVDANKLISLYDIYQNFSYTHPLTCTNSNHSFLKAKKEQVEKNVDAYKVFLCCSDCDYKQSYLPFFEDECSLDKFSIMIDEMKKMESIMTLNFNLNMK